VAASSTSIGGQSYVKVELRSLNSPASEELILSTSFRPSFEAQRRLKLVALVGAEAFELQIEFRDEVFEPQTIKGEDKYKQGAR
jgi:hypothetical protein